MNHQQQIPCFGFWRLDRGFTVRVFWLLFQAKRQRDEIFSQRRDRRRIRLLGWLFKLFGGS